jgi:hypothetical protein
MECNVELHNIYVEVLLHLRCVSAAYFNEMCKLYERAKFSSDRYRNTI